MRWVMCSWRPMERRLWPASSRAWTVACLASLSTRTAPHGARRTTTAAIALIPGPVTLLVVLSILAGAVQGNLTLLQATAVTDRWGTTHYGRLSALLGAPAHIADALAPWAGAALAGRIGGYPHLFAAMAVISAAAPRTTRLRS